MENCAVVIAVLDVAQKVGDCFGGKFCVEFKHDLAKIGLEFHLWIGGVGDESAKAAGQGNKELSDHESSRKTKKVCGQGLSGGK
jgi:uncharacterized membrane protein